jgi:hypothetical protein
MFDDHSRGAVRLRLDVVSNLGGEFLSDARSRAPRCEPPTDLIREGLR